MQINKVGSTELYFLQVHTFAQEFHKVLHTLFFEELEHPHQYLECSNSET